MPLEYRYRVYSISRDINEFNRYTHSTARTHTYIEDKPPGFARECMMEFMRYNRAEWFVENGIAISVETYVDSKTFQYRADLIAHMTYEQREEYREKEIIDKLSNSYNNKNEKTNIPF